MDTTMVLNNCELTTTTLLFKLNKMQATEFNFKKKNSQQHIET